MVWVNVYLSTEFKKKRKKYQIKLIIEIYLYHPEKHLFFSDDLGRHYASKIPSAIKNILRTENNTI